MQQFMYSRLILSATHHSSLNQVANEILIQNVKDENGDLKITLVRTAHFVQLSLPTSETLLLLCAISVHVGSFWFNYLFVYF